MGCLGVALLLPSCSSRADKVKCVSTVNLFCVELSTYLNCQLISHNHLIAYQLILHTHLIAYQLTNTFAFMSILVLGSCTSRGTHTHAHTRTHTTHTHTHTHTQTHTHKHTHGTQRERERKRERDIHTQSLKHTINSSNSHWPERRHVCPC